MPLNGITRDDIESFMHAVADGKTASRTRTKPRGYAHVRGGKGTASRTVGLLGATLPNWSLLVQQVGKRA
jgi:hypothetical protein